MAERGSPIGEMLQNFMTLAQVKSMQDQLLVQQEQVANQRRAQTVQGYGQYLELLRQSPDPTVHDELEVAFEQQGFDRAALRQLRLAAVPQEGITKQGDVAAGRRIVSGQETPVTPELGAIQTAAYSQSVAGAMPGSVAADAFRSRALANVTLPIEQVQSVGNAAAIAAATGQDFGSFLQGQDYSALNPELRKQMQLIRGGVAPSASDQLSYDIAAKNNALGWANLRQDERLTLSAQALQKLGIQTDMARIAAADKGGFTELLQEATKLANILDSKSPKSAMEVENLVSMTNQINAKLTNAGIAPPAAVVIYRKAKAGENSPTGWVTQQMPGNYVPQPGEQIVQRIPRVMKRSDIAPKGFVDWAVN